MSYLTFAFSCSLLSSPLFVTHSFVLFHNISSYTKPIADSVPQHLCYSMERPQVLGLCGHGNDNEKETTMVKEDEDELELGLGLSLGGVVNKAISNKNFNSYGRILTAKDLLNGFSCGNKRERSAATDHDDHGSSSAAAVSQVVGWPPIRSYRMSTMFSQPKNSNIEEDDNNRDVRKADNENSNKKMNHGNEKIEKNGIKERSVIGFVKVNMDGLPIGRKVDLNAQKSYETLAKTLEDMFFTTRGEKEQSTHHGPKLLDASSEFVLTYEDKEGDWMLLGDVPWRMFLNTVRRLRIMRTSEANGLAPKLQEKNEKQRAIPT